MSKNPKLNSWCKGMELGDGDFSGCVCDCPACKERAEALKDLTDLLKRIDLSMEFVYKVVTKERKTLGPAGLDGHLNAIGGTVIEVRDWIKKRSKPTRELTPQEKAKGRSDGYWDMSPESQWEEDKRLGILDWDGK